MHIKRETCFVIQPFDNDKFDKRYNDVFAPAIEAAGLIPYRVDKDQGVRVPIAAIQEGIRNAAYCLADITIDNSNVWYELGMAIEASKDVVLLCSDERTGNYPFDIRHINIIRYKTGSKSDYADLETAITTKLEAFKTTRLGPNLVVSSTNTISTINQGEPKLKPYEYSLLSVLMEEQPVKCCGVHLNSLQEKYAFLGYSGFEFSLASRGLFKIGYIDYKTYQDEYGYEITVYQLTDKGEQWVFDNVDLFIPPSKVASTADDLPF